MKNKYNTEHIRSLVRPDCVHKDVYIDPVIFGLEVDRIFARSWNYLCHESQLAHPGDYLTTDIGGNPVIVIRHEDNLIRVLHNRCAHRGAKLLENKQGHTEVISCSYHGWRYKTDGELLSIPCRDNYQDTDIENNQADYGLSGIRADNYRGFVFANLSNAAPDLADCLGGARRALDNMVDRSPERELEAVVSSFRAIYRNNWKIYLENLHDGMHPLTVHQSSIAASREQISRIEKTSDKMPPLALQLVQANAQSYQQMKDLEVTCYEYGHSDMRGFRNPDNDADPAYREYVNRHQQSYGMEKSAEILNMNLHNVNFYPNASAHPRFLQLRVVRPLAVDKTAIEITVFRWKGAPDEINRRNITYANTIHSPSSLIKPDDLEAYRRVQEGLLSSGREWISQHSLFDPNTDDVSPQSALSEQYIRNQYRAWLAYMCSPDIAPGPAPELLHSKAGVEALVNPVPPDPD